MSFEDFWAAYPRKKAKGDAEKAWKQTTKSRPELSVLLAAIEEQKRDREWQKEGGQFIPYPATWLRGKRWEDSVSNAGAPTPDPLAEERARLRKEVFALTELGGDPEVVDWEIDMLIAIAHADTTEAMATIRGRINARRSKV